MSDPSQPPPTPSGPPQPPQTWAPPGAAPFGPPPAGPYAPPAGYATPAGFGAAPGAASAAYGTPAPARRRSTLGWLALALALVAAVGASVFAAIASFQIGSGAGREIASRPLTTDFDWSVLTPVRDWVLMGEVAFWAGTVIGLWALIQGVVAIVTSRGRGPGIAAVVIAALGPVAFGVVVQGFLAAGLTAGTGIGG